MKTIKMIFCALVLASLVSCGNKQESVTLAGPDPQKIVSVSGGIIQRTAPVEVLFTSEQDVSVAVPAASFVLEPAAKGTLAWKDAHTLAWTPTEPLKAGTRYTVKVDLAKVAGIEPFAFNFETPIPVIDVLFDPVRVTDKGEVLVSGTVVADQDNDIRRIAGIIQDSELGQPDWIVENGVYRFAFKPVYPGEAPRTVAISWSGESVGAKESDFTTVRIPGSRFEVLDIVPDTNGALEVVFSAPLRTDQDLRGFVSLSDNTDIRYSLDGNIVRIFGVENGDVAALPAGTTLQIQDVPALDGKVLFEPVQYVISAPWELPEARFVGSGTILPTSQGTVLTIETRNLSGVMVEAFQVYGDNMVQFLQVNDLNGNKEFNRVGEPVWTKSFDLRWRSADKNRWVRQGLDLSELSRKYPGSLFHIRMTFRKKHIQYECTASHGDFSQLVFPPDSFPVLTSREEESYWDTIEYNHWDYDWYRYRKDPCHPAFYSDYDDHAITVGRNVLISDLGLLAKRGRDGAWFAAATNIKTAAPVANIQLKLINYQGRVLATALTGADGTAAFAEVASSGTIFLAAESPLGTAYLKLNDSLSLATSHFDVSGGSPLTAIRGLIYGERGVWRPGDDIYLTFLLSDPAHTLPADHPVLFEFEDPRGRITDNRTFTTSIDGFYPITVSTAASDPTGDWTARVKVGGTVYNKTVKVETIIPNRLKMDLNFAGRTRLDSDTMPATLGAAWLYGAPAPGLHAEVQVAFSDTGTTFPAYGDYSFRDPSRSVSSERQTVFSGVLDAAGGSRFDIQLNAGAQVPGKLTAQFYTRVFESSGAFSSEQVGIEFSPYRRYLGIKLPKGDTSRDMLLTDVDHTVEVAVLDADGKPWTEAVAIDCAVYKLSWRWWWEKGADERAEFTEGLSHNPVYQGSTTAQSGKATWQFQVKYPAWGRYLVLVRDRAGGHSAASVAYIDWPNWAGRSQDQGQGGQSMLTLTPEKPSYRPGETIAVTFPSNKEAQALIVIEKSGQILKREWIACTDTVTRYEITADPSMTPNIYVHVTLLQRHLQTINDLPLRLYGITPVMVDDPATRLVPQIQTASNWQAESPVSFTISEASGRPMTYTVAVVDEGLLGLTRYTLPDPQETFYAKEASFIKSWDLFSDIASAYTGQLETLLAIGGGDDGTGDPSKQSERWKPVTRYFGPYQLPAGQTHTEEFTLPPYIGAVRIMVLAASPSISSEANKSRAFGTAEKSVTVSSDLMIFTTVPRTLSGGDEAVIPVSVYSYRAGGRQVSVTLNIEGGTLMGMSQRSTLVFDQPGELIVNYRIKADALPGIAYITAQAESAGLKSAVHRTEVTVRTTAVPVTTTQTTLVQAGGTWTGQLTAPGMTGTNTAVVEFSRMPPINLEQRLSYLIEYPHGCVEQTTSAVFPQLYLHKVQQLDTEKTAEIRTNINAGIEQLKSFQTADGGFSYWPGDEWSHAWGSSYAGHFLIEAQRAGYALPSGMIEKWVTYQRGKAAAWSSWNGDSQLDQSYRLYTLALSGNADIGSMNRLREQRPLESQATWRLAATYWLAGQRSVALSLTKTLNTLVTSYRELNGTFGSQTRDTAMILETMGLLGQITQAQPLITELSRTLSTDNWLSTQETAYALIAITSLFQMDTTTVTMTYSLGSRSENIIFSAPLARVDMGMSENAPFRIMNRSSAPVYARVIAKGIPAEGSEPALAAGLEVNVSYRNSAGVVINPDTAGAGEDIAVRVTVRNTFDRAVPEIALVHPVPASWEIINYRLGGGASSNADINYQDIRDDRIMTYFDLRRGETKTFVFTVNKAYTGNFFRPSVQAYALYDESIRAIVPGVRF
jgi:uncharacterized protein YfaS (alpha-2-macroglobulin family)